MFKGICVMCIFVGAPPTLFGVIINPAKSNTTVRTWGANSLIRFVICQECSRRTGFACRIFHDALPVLAPSAHYTAARVIEIARTVTLMSGWYIVSTRWCKHFLAPEFVFLTPAFNRLSYTAARVINISSVHALTLMCFSSQSKCNRSLCGIDPVAICVIGPPHFLAPDLVSCTRVLSCHGVQQQESNTRMPNPMTARVPHNHAPRDVYTTKHALIISERAAM